MSFLTFLNSLSTVRFTPLFLILLAVASIPGTFLKSTGNYYSSPLFIALLMTLVTSVLICTAKRIRSIRPASFLIHTGIIIVAAGGLIRYFNGYVATVNMYENSTINSAFRWDLGKDTPLPFSLTLDKIGAEFYGAPVKIGVLENGVKKRLVTTTVGSSFTLGKFDILVDKIFEKPDSLILKVSEKGEGIAFIDTSRPSANLKGLPYSFKLVAYKNPELKRSWGELALTSKEKGVIKGLSEVNSPLKFGSVSIFHVQNGFDESGRLYAGFQLVQDPGRNVVFAGLFVISAGAVLLPFSRANRSSSVV